MYVYGATRPKLAEELAQNLNDDETSTQYKVTEDILILKQTTAGGHLRLYLFYLLRYL